MKHLLLTTIAAVVLVGTVFADPIHDVAWKGDLAGVQRELNKGADVNAMDDDAWTPLHYAATYDHKETAKLLTVKGVDVNTKNDEGETALHQAAHGGHKEVAELLISKGADVNAKQDGGGTPLHSAAWEGHKEVAELLLANGADVNAKTVGGWTPLHQAAWVDVIGRGGHKEVAELLISNGADVNAKHEFGYTPLHFAASGGLKEIAELLLANGADVNVKDDFGRTPLDLCHFFVTANLLHKYGAKTGAELKALMPRLVQHGRFAFSFVAKEGKVYEVQDSFNLLNWEPIRTYTGTGVSVRFDEERDHDPPQWFYRVKMVE